MEFRLIYFAFGSSSLLVMTVALLAPPGSPIEQKLAICFAYVVVVFAVLDYRYNGLLVRRQPLTVHWLSCARVVAQEPMVRGSAAAYPRDADESLLGESHSLLITAVPNARGDDAPRFTPQATFAGAICHLLLTD